MLAHNKFSLLTAYNAIHQHDVLYIYEAYLDPSVSVDNNILSIQGYNLFRSDHTDDVKRGSVCTYNKKYQSIRRIDILHICESVVCEVTMQSNKGYIVVIYQSPCQSWAKFDNFLSRLGQLLDLIENLTHL